LWGSWDLPLFTGNRWPSRAAVESCPARLPSPGPAAQVFHVLRRMDELGCDLFLDIHGDEEIAANFLAGSEGVPSWNEAMAALAKTFMTGCARARARPRSTQQHPPRAQGPRL